MPGHIPHRLLSALIVLLSLCCGIARAQKPAIHYVVDYDKMIKPLLTSRCYACHGNGTKLGGLRLDSRADVLKGGASGPAVVVGHASESLLIKLVSGAQPGRIMPARGARLTASEITLLRNWIDSGLTFGASGAQAAWSAPLLPRRPPVPAAKPGSGLHNPIDLLLQPYFAAHKVAPKPVVDDAAYCRRVSLDTIGLLPSPEELDAFIADRRQDKRALLAARLLEQNRSYAEHWISFWNDMLRNDYVGTGYIDGGRTQITDWLHDSLAANKPFDKFCTELINPGPESAGFIKGIVWRGVVNASQTTEMQAAQNVSQVFQGVNLKCASCHNSFISTWKLADAYGMAGIFSDRALEMVRCDRPTGQTANIKFLYPELGPIDSSAPRAQRQQQLAAILTSKTNGRLARTFVNHLWGKLMGRGLVEPTDEMDNRPWNPDLLDWLSADFADHNYDVRRTILQIVSSRAYQLPAVGMRTERSLNFTFAGPVVKRMSAEQFVDAVSTLTGVWPRPATGMRIERGKPVVPNGGSVKFASPPLKSGSVDIDIDITGAEVLSLIVASTRDKIDLAWADWAEPRITGQSGETKLTDMKWFAASTGYGLVQINKSVVEKPIRIDGKVFPNGLGTHANSVITYLLPPGATRFRATVGPDTGATEQANAPTSVAFYVVTGERSLVQARASMTLADPLMRAMDRPNREQVVSQRSTVATTLQALELTNGQTLSQILTQGAERWSASTASPAQLARALYRKALGRWPSAAEAQAANSLLGPTVTREGTEDLIWSLVMQPEFQLIY